MTEGAETPTALVRLAVSITVSSMLRVVSTAISGTSLLGRRSFREASGLVSSMWTSWFMIKQDRFEVALCSLGYNFQFQLNLCNYHTVN